MFKALSIAFMFLLLMSQPALTQQPQWKNADYDAVRDFSIQSNPNGVWSYGWEATLGQPLNLYTFGDTCLEGFSIWRYSQDCREPIIAHNDTGKKICFWSWCVPTTQLWLHPSFDGQNGKVTVLRWTAPSTGRFLIEGSFMGLDFGGPTTTDVHVLVNSKKSLLSGPITSYKWPLIFNMIVKVSAGDTIDFAVGWGKDPDQKYDSTGVRFAVTHLGK